jgi:hypothetical protein
MSTTFTTNKNLIEPASGSFTNAWAAPVNSDWTAIDNAFGGNTVISVIGVTAGTYALTIAQYQPPNIEFTGTLSGNLVYVIPAGVGGIWTVSNATTGAFTISIGVTGGTSAAVLQGFRTLIVSDGSTVTLADTSAPAQAQANAEAFATAADAVVLASAESFASSAAATAQSNAEAFSADASNLSSGQVPNAVLPEIGDMPGVTIQADPGGTPIGGPFEMFFYY